MAEQRNRNLWLVAAVVAVTGHLLGLYLPGSAEPTLVLPPGSDKVIHVFLFGIPVWVLGRLTGRVGVVAAVFIGHAVLSELVQWRFVPYRSGDPWDATADLVGIGLAVWALSRRPKEPTRR